MTWHALNRYARRSPRRLSLIVLLFFAGLPGGLGAAAARTNAAGACWGPVRAVPASVLIGGQVTLSGGRFHCTSPMGGLLPQAAFILYRPGVGFHVYTVHVGPHGAYRRTVTIPVHLRSVDAINGGPGHRVATRPGTYYLAVRLFDVALPPVSQAAARITVLPSAPSGARIRAVMARTVEVSHPSTHFAPLGGVLTIADGRGTGTLTAVVGTRFPTADALGQVVFFWSNTRFIGWDSSYEKMRVARVASPAPGTFVIDYAHYRTRDPACCPTLPPVRVTSGWSGTMLISNGVPPSGPGAPVTIRLLPRALRGA